MIWHIFKKDFRLLWHFALGVAAVGWLATILIYRNDNGASGLGQMFNLLLILQLAACIILATTAVQLDALPGVRQDWLTRPIKRRDLLLAKLLFVLLLVQGPMFVADFTAAATDGLPAGRALGVALARSLCFLCTFLVPALALASITRSFMETVVGGVAAAAGVAGLFQVINIQFPWYWRMYGHTGADWLITVSAMLAGVVGVTAILALQYFRRRTLAARLLTGGFALLCVGINFSPWNLVFAIQQRLSPNPGVASGVQIAFQPAIGRYQEKTHFSSVDMYGSRGRETATPIYLPFSITGLDSNAILKTDHVAVRLIGLNGTSDNLGRITPVVIDGGSPRYDRSTRLQIYARDSIFARYRDMPVRLELDLSLTLLHLSATRKIPAVGGRQSIAETGRCETHLNRASTAVQLQCLQAGETPPCVSFFLEHPPTGQRNPEILRCDGGYEPFPIEPEPDALRRPGLNLPFRDPADLWHLPVDGPLLKESQVVMKFYQPKEHFTRRIVIPDVRLSDWLPM